MNIERQRQARFDRIKRCLHLSAQCAEMNPLLGPVFERLDVEMAAALAGGDAVDRVRAMLRFRKLAAA